MRKFLRSAAGLLLLHFSVVLSAQKLPPHSRIIFFGDSQTEFAYKANGNVVQYQNYGYVSWVNALAPGVQTPKGGVLGVGGETTSQMLNRLGAISGFNAKFIAVLAGTNDPLYAIGPETTKANLRKIYDAGIANGMKVLAICLLPRFAPNAYNAAVEANRISINNWIKSQTDVVVIDAEAELNAPENFEDGLHNSPLGAYKLGKKVAEAVNNLVFSCAPGSQLAADLSRAANSNPLLTGTTGKLNTATGAVAAYWELNAGFAGGATVSGSKETDADGKERQVINISGSYGTNTRRVTFNNYAALPISLAAGDVVEGISEIEIPSAMTNIRGIYLKVIVYDGNWNFLSDGCSMFPTSNKPLNIPVGKYILRTPPMTIGAGTVGQLITQVWIEFNNTTSVVPVSATVKLSSAGVRRLPLANGPLATITPAGTIAICPGGTQVLSANTGSGYTYQWKLNGANLSSGSGSAYSATSTGSYTVAISAPGCSVLSDPTQIVAATCTTNTIATGSVAAKLCAGSTVQVPFTVSNGFNSGNVFTAQLSDAGGSFANPVSIGSLAGTGSGSITATVPSSMPQGTAYRIRIVANNPAATGTDNGANIAIYSTPVLTSTSTPPAICNNSLLAYTPTATPAGTTFAWSRAAVAGLTNGAASGTGNISETLQNTSAGPISVSYLYQLSNNGCTGNAYPVTVTVNPSPVARSKNISVNLGTGGTVTITPQQVDNGSTGFCGSLQYSLDKTQFGCANIGNNSVTLRVADAAGNVSTATAIITVTDPTGVCQVSTITTGAIVAKLCSGQAVDVPYSVSNAFGAGNIFRAQLSDANGSFANPVVIGSLTATGPGIIKAAIPAGTAGATGYRIRVVASSPAVTGTANGANITISQVPVLTSTLSPPAVCNNSSFAYTPTATPAGTTFTWSRATVSGISNAANTGSGPVSEVLVNTTAAPVNVPYTYQLNNNGCTSPLNNVVVTVNPSPVVRTRNITADLNASGSVTITPQQIDNGSSGFCGPLQLSLSKSVFTCTNLGVNTVTVTARDQAGNSQSATATVTVRDVAGPVIGNAAVSATVLWPADQRMKRVTVSYTVSENCGGTVSPELSVRSNEPVSWAFLGDRSPDWDTGDKDDIQYNGNKITHTLRLRAERSPFREGRVYTITIQVTDGRGNRTTRELQVSVPLLAPSSTKAGARLLDEQPLMAQESGLLQLSALPNPSGSHFTIVLKSGSALPVTLRILDASGRLVESRSGLAANSSLQIGQLFRPGLYLLEVEQGRHKSVLRLLKAAP